MTVTINLPSREAFDALPDVFFWPVPMRFKPEHGRTGHCCFAGCNLLPCGCCASSPHPAHGLEPIPDPEWVKAGEPCERCGGDGLRRSPTDCGAIWPGGCECVIECAHCHGTGDTSDGRPCWRCSGSGRASYGKPLIAITVPCHVCEIAGRACVPHQEQGHTEKQYVTVGQAVIERGPVMVKRSPGIFAPPVVVVYDDGVGFWDSGAEEPDIIDLGPDPASLVGTWQVACRKVQP